MLEETKDAIGNSFEENGIPKDINGIKFEEIVFNKMIKSSQNTVFYNHVEQTGLQSFPDIIARKLYGVEVKMTSGDKWISTGNSILETTRKDDVETIYMFFGKFGKRFAAKYRKYQDCLSDVAVTHSPRYKIDMNLPEGSSIFDKIGIEYNSFRKEEYPVKRLKDYYRKNLKSGEELWWIDNADETPAIPIIKSFRSLDKKNQDKYIKECMILFPEIFGGSTIKFEKAAAYLITKYNSFSSNLRDNFTAGGKMLVPNIKEPQPQILYKLFSYSKDITKLIETISTETLEYYWQIPIDNNPLEVWQDLLRKHSSVAANIFINGLS